jgi:anaerobic selenocysteine-containing dehydrogenase
MADHGAREFPLLNGTHGSLVNEAIVNGSLPVQVLFIIGHNFLLTAENTEMCRQVMHKVPFSVTFDLFMTPTAALSDLFLPVTTWLERNQLTTPYTRFGQFARVKVVDPPGECRDDEDILLELAHRLGLHEAFPWNTVEEYLDWRLAGTCKTFRELKEEGQYLQPQHYEKYATDYFRKGGGFPTPTGRVEVYQTTFKKNGHDPFPFYVEPVEEVPIQCCVGQGILPFNRPQDAYFFHTEHHQIPELRKFNPDPLVEINREAAGALGIGDGDWVWIETRKGRIRQKAKLIDGIHPRVICNQHAWWYPEREGPEYGLWESNLNIITRNDRDRGLTRSTVALGRGFLCKIYRAERT